MTSSAVLRGHVAKGKVVIGVNHALTDWVNNKRKKLDLVLARPGGGTGNPRRRSMQDFFRRWSVDLDDAEVHALAALPLAYEGDVGSVLVAMEAKACMTEHSKAGPRLHHELNSSHGIVHAASNNALAVGFVKVNAAEAFVSPDRNRGVVADAERTVSRH